MSDFILELQDLKTYFPVKGSRTQFVKAVDGVSFQVKKGGEEDGMLWFQTSRTRAQTSPKMKKFG